MGFFQDVSNGYKIMFNQFKNRFGVVAPKAFSGVGTGLMMIGSAVMAKTAYKDETKQAIEEANRAIEEIKAGNNKKKHILKAKVNKTWKVVKIFRKGIAFELGGAACNAIGIGMSEHGRTKALTACAAVGAQFAGYRAAVREDLGTEADVKYMTGQKYVSNKNKKKTKKNNENNEETYLDENGVVITKDPNAFRFWFSRETCPSIWSDNYDLRLAKLNKIESDLSLQYLNTRVTGGALTLNDMRREFGGLEPHKMDVDIGGIFGRVWVDHDKSTHKLIDLHYKDDENFMSGRTDSCWIIFDCDPVPIVGRFRNKLAQV